MGFVIDRGYLSLFYAKEIEEAVGTSISILYYENVDDTKEKIQLVVSWLFVQAGEITKSMRQALAKDCNSIVVKLEDQSSVCVDKGQEALLRKIFHDVFNVIIEPYEPSSASQLHVSWGDSQANELRLLLGEKERFSVTESARRQNQFRLSGKYCDFRFLVKGQEFFVHKCILSAYSDYFDTLFSANFRESETKEPVPFGDEGLVAEVFESFLNYIYTAVIVLAEANVGKIIQLANLAKLCLDERLLKLCMAKLHAYINKENYLEVASAAVCFEDKSLIASCQHYLAKNRQLFEGQRTYIEFFSMRSTDSVCNQIT